MLIPTLDYFEYHNKINIKFKLITLIELISARNYKIIRKMCTILVYFESNLWYARLFSAIIN